MPLPARFRLTPLDVTPSWPESAEDLEARLQLVTPAGFGALTRRRSEQGPLALRRLNDLGALQVALLGTPLFAGCEPTEIWALHDEIPRRFRGRQRPALIEKVAQVLLTYARSYQRHREAPWRELVDLAEALRRLEGLLPAPAPLPDPALPLVPPARRRVHRLADCWREVREWVLRRASEAANPWPEQEERGQLLQDLVRAFAGYVERNIRRWSRQETWYAVAAIHLACGLECGTRRQIAARLHIRHQRLRG